MSLARNIKQTIALLNKVIGQAPLDKQPLLADKVNKVITKYKNTNPDQNLSPYLK